LLEVMVVNNGISRVRSLQMLKVFVTASQLGSFTASSAELNMTQSAVSQQIKRLEEIVGFELFFRRSRGVELTEQGQTLLNQIRPIFAVLSNEDSKAKLPGKEIKIALPFNLAQQWVQDSLSRFKGVFGQFELHIDEADFDTREQGKHDLALMKLHVDEAKQLSSRWKFCQQDMLVPVCSPQYLRANAIGDLSRWAETFGLLEGSAVSKGKDGISWADWLMEQGRIPRSTNEVISFDNPGLLLQAARAGCGVALASRSEIVQDLQTNALMELPAEPMWSDYGYYIMVRDTLAEQSANTASKQRHDAIMWLHKSMCSLIAENLDTDTMLNRVQGMLA